MTFRKKKTIVGFMALVCSVAFIASAEVRAYPPAPAGSQNQSANNTTFVEKTTGEDDSKLLFVCGFPCCGINYHGPCPKSKCCSKGKGIGHTPENPMNDVEEAGNGGGGHQEDNGSK